MVGINWSRVNNRLYTCLLVSRLPSNVNQYEILHMPLPPEEVDTWGGSLIFIKLGVLF